MLELYVLINYAHCMCVCFMCSYNQVSFSDDSAEHKFELGTFKVCNHLSNCRFPVSFVDNMHI